MSSMCYPSCYLLLLLVASVVCKAICGSPVEYLPGFDGKLPFKLETGYITVRKSELFYSFIESEGNPKEDPIFVWWSGGPGCSALNGLLMEIGPLAFNTDYIDGPPQLLYCPHTWTKAASIIFLDIPVGTGFSYATSTDGWLGSDTLSAAEIHEFLRKWFDEHPEFLKVPLFIGADSYSGILVPMVAQNILDGNQNPAQLRLNLKGYIVGSANTDEGILLKSRHEFTHRTSLISRDDGYNEGSCKTNDHRNEHPYYLQYSEAIMRPKKMSRDANTLESELPRRTIVQRCGDFIFSSRKIHEFFCQSHGFINAVTYMWANDPEVQKALHVRKGTIHGWRRCNISLAYTSDVLSVIDHHRNLSSLDLHVLAYDGDSDPVLPYTGTLEWIKILELDVVDDWRPWFVDNDAVGYTIKYNKGNFNLTYALVKEAGHAPQVHKRRECFMMFQRWLHRHSL